MKNILLVFCWVLTLFACFTDTVASETGDVSPAMAVAESASTPQEATPRAELNPVEQRVPDEVKIGTETIQLVEREEVKDEVTKAGEEQRSRMSRLNVETCCTIAEPIKSCCCENVVQTYKKLLVADDLVAAGKLKTTDPYYARCLSQQTEFENLIEKAETDVWGE